MNNIYEPLTVLERQGKYKEVDYSVKAVVDPDETRRFYFSVPSYGIFDEQLVFLGLHKGTLTKAEESVKRYIERIESAN